MAKFRGRAAVEPDWACAVGGEAPTEAKSTAIQAIATLTISTLPLSPPLAVSQPQ